MVPQDFMSPHQPDGDMRWQGHPLAVLGRLQAACANDVHASLMAAHWTLSCAGRLRSATDEGVVFEIPFPPPGADLLGSSASISYPTGDKTAGFVADVIAVDRTSDGALLATLALPEEIRVGERRASVRVPVPRDTLRAELVGGGDVQPVEAVDLSLHGILIEVDATTASTLARRRTVTLELRLGKTRVTTDAHIRRRDGRRFGLRFITKDEPPDGMAKLIWKLTKARRPTR